MSAELEDLSGALLASAAHVHRELGPGLPVAIYEAALAVELGHRGVELERSPAVAIQHRGVEVGSERVSLLVASLLVEVVDALDERTVGRFRSLVRASARPQGLLVAFGRTELEARRVFARDRPGESILLSATVHARSLAPAAETTRRDPVPVYPASAPD